MNTKEREKEVHLIEEKPDRRMTIKLMERLDNHLSSEAKQTKSKTIQLSHCKSRKKKEMCHGTEFNSNPASFPDPGSRRC